MPTSYRGLSELGENRRPRDDHRVPDQRHLAAGAARRAEAAGRAAPDGVCLRWRRSTVFIERHRIAVVAGTLGVVVLASPLLLFLPFDFNPLHLQRPQGRSRSRPSSNCAAIRRPAPTRSRSWRPNLAAAAAQSAPRLAALPEVARAQTLDELHPAPTRTRNSPHPTAGGHARPRRLIRRKPAAADRRREHRGAAVDRRQLRRSSPPRCRAPAATPQNACPGCWLQLATAEPAARQRVATAFVEPLRVSLDRVAGARSTRSGSRSIACRPI